MNNVADEIFYIKVQEGDERNSVLPQTSSSKVGGSRPVPAATSPAKASTDLGGWDEWGQQDAMLSQGQLSDSCSIETVTIRRLRKFKSELCTHAHAHLCIFCLP